MASVDREDNRFGGLTIEDVLDLSGEREADLLKLNIEGAEEALFAARSCERWIDRVGAIVVEPHDLKTLEVITTRVSDSGFVLADSKETLSPFVLFVRAQPN